MSKRKKPTLEDLYPRTIETFRPIGEYELGQLEQKEPSSFNGFVRVLKYKVTVEIVPEEVDVITSRIQDLWDICDNYHHHTPLEEIAKKYNYQLQGKPGNKVRK